MTTTSPDSSATAPSAPSEPVSDPLPMRPQKPLPFDCCESGCARCVFDIYADELASYELALTAWRARHPGRDSGAD